MASTLDFAAGQVADRAESGSLSEESAELGRRDPREAAEVFELGEGARLGIDEIEQAFEAIVGEGQQSGMVKTKKVGENEKNEGFGFPIGKPIVGASSYPCLLHALLDQAFGGHDQIEHGVSGKLSRDVRFTREVEMGGEVADFAPGSMRGLH